MSEFKIIYMVVEAYICFERDQFVAFDNLNMHIDIIYGCVLPKQLN
jgi:hypothetical protein